MRRYQPEIQERSKHSFSISGPSLSDAPPRDDNGLMDGEVHVGGVGLDHPGRGADNSEEAVDVTDDAGESSGISKSSEDPWGFRHSQSEEKAIARRQRAIDAEEHTAGSGDVPPAVDASGSQRHLSFSASSVPGGSEDIVLER